MNPELTPHSYPCVRCGELRKLSIPEGLCWTPKPDDPRKDDSCYRAAVRVRQEDRMQDAQSKYQKGAA